MYRLRVLAFLSVLIAFSDFSEARALELFGYCFGSSCDDKIESELIDPKFYDVNFEFSGSSEIEAEIKSRSELLRNSNTAVAGSAGLVSRARGDYRRLLSGLYEAGHYSGSVSILVNGTEAAEIGPGTDMPDTSNVEIIVDAGEPYVFGAFLIENKASQTFDTENALRQPEDFSVQSGDPARSGSIKRAIRHELMLWRQQGYPDADISEQSVTADHPARELNVKITLSPGSKAYYGETRVDGATSVDEDFVIYMTDISPGDAFDPDDLAKARKRLDRLDLFSLRKVEGAGSVKPDGSYPIQVTIKEKKPRRIGIGLTTSTTEGAGIEAFWLRRNLFGRAEQLRLEGSVEGLGDTFTPDELDYQVSATFRKPGVFSPDTDWATQIYGQRSFNDTFDGEAIGGSSAIEHLFSKSLTGTFGGFVEYSDFTDAFGPRDLFVAGVETTLTFDGRDESSDPKKGWYAKGEVRAFHEFRRTNTALRFEGELRHYKSIDTAEKTTIAARVKLGSLLGIDRQDTPANILFFAGGGNSVRGYGFKNIGVTEPNGSITGGRSLLETSLELRHRFNDNWGAVLFADAGLVDKDSFVTFDEDIRVGVGAGVRYFTSLGPIRLDVAVPLDARSGDPDFSILAGIGQAF